MDKELIDQSPHNPHFGKYGGKYIVREAAREAFREHWRSNIPDVDSWSADQLDEAIWHGF